MNYEDTSNDGCLNQHHVRVVSSSDLGWDVRELQVHPLVCFHDGRCFCQHHILRHYDVLRTLWSHVYTTRRSHFSVVSISKTLAAGDFYLLLENTKLHDYADLLATDLNLRSADVV